MTRPDGTPQTELLAAMTATWPAAATVTLGAWTLRRGEGGGNRVSAATLDGAEPGDIGAAERAMRAWRQVPLFMLRPGETALDAELEGRGYALRDPVILLEAPAGGLAFDGPEDRVAFGPAALPVMAGIWARGGIGPERLAIMARPAERCFLLGRDGDRPAACGFVARDGRIAMLHALEVAPAARRKGVGAVMTRGAATWATEAGAEVLALAVTEANAAARALYAGLGMREAARYHYRQAPAER